MKYSRNLPCKRKLSFVTLFNEDGLSHLCRFLTKEEALSLLDNSDVVNVVMLDRLHRAFRRFAVSWPARCLYKDIFVYVYLNGELIRCSGQFSSLSAAVAYCSNRYDRYSHNFVIFRGARFVKFIKKLKFDYE